MYIICSPGHVRQNINGKLFLFTTGYNGIKHVQFTGLNDKTCRYYYENKHCNNNHLILNEILY